jgi:thioredoxin 1
LPFADSGKRWLSHRNNAAEVASRKHAVRLRGQARLATIQYCSQGGIEMAMTSTFAEVEPLRAEIDAFDGAAVIEFGTPWCGYCKAAQPLIRDAFADYPAVKHIKVEDGSGRPLGRSFKVKLWPTLIFMKQGQEVARLVRPGDSAAIAQALAQIGST